jgi:hypothetical protein
MESLGINLPPDEVGDYQETVLRHTTGPQIEGIDISQYEKVVDDPRTVFVELSDRNIPFITSLDYAPWVNREFLEFHGHDPKKTFVQILPQVISADNPEVCGKAYDDFFSRYQDHALLIDYPEEVEPFYKTTEVDGITIDQLETSNETPAATFHYHCKFSPDEQALDEYVPSKNAVEMSRDQIESSFDRMWSMYQEQFQLLVNDHVVNGALAKDDLYQSLTTNGVSVYAYVNDDGEIDAFGYLTEDTEDCPWLNQDYMKDLQKQYDRPLLFMPGIVTDLRVRRPVGQEIMKKILFENLKKFGEWALAFECSNISAQYVPKLVKRSVERAEIGSMTELAMTRHLYEVANRGQ